MNRLPARYRRYRRTPEKQEQWYRESSFGPADFSPPEVDLVLFHLMSLGHAILANRTLSARLEGRNFPLTESLRSLFRNQILIDELADFSPLQIACMRQLCDPTVSSFVACGDFNQRITSWGSRSERELKWVDRKLEIRKINITYRHSSQLQEFTARLLRLSGAPDEKTELPDLVDNEGVPPALALSAGPETLVAWLADRIFEIERMTEGLPTIAVLVNSEEEVQPLADRLSAALAQANIRCMGYPKGQVRGQDGDVRVFDVQHIKGLEFEAVFFIGIDTLAERHPTCSISISMWVRPVRRSISVLRAPVPCCPRSCPALAISSPITGSVDPQAVHRLFPTLELLPCLSHPASILSIAPIMGSPTCSPSISPRHCRRRYLGEASKGRSTSR